MRGYSKSQIIARNRRVMLFVSIIITLLIGFIFFTVAADAEGSRELYTYYDSYEIQPGDTLWSIADTYMGPDYMDKDEFINRIKEMNHLSEDYITAGNYLVIEYYSYDKL